MAWIPDPIEQPSSTDEQALARYRYMLRTAPPEAIEKAHETAFARLSPAQRQQALQQLATRAPGEERNLQDDPKSLARLATRSEIREPGLLERLFGGSNGNGGFGSALGGSLLGALAANFIGSGIARAFFDENPYGSQFEPAAQSSAYGPGDAYDHQGATENDDESAIDDYGYDGDLA
jgi:hypothetical protein